MNLVTQAMLRKASDEDVRRLARFVGVSAMGEVWRIRLELVRRLQRITASDWLERQERSARGE